jgi:hypothetical protein
MAGRMRLIPQTPDAGAFIKNLIRRFIYNLKNEVPETFPSTLPYSADYLGSFNDR